MVALDIGHIHNMLVVRRHVSKTSHSLSDDSDERYLRLTETTTVSLPSVSMGPCEAHTVQMTMKKRVNVESRMEVRLAVETAWRGLKSH